MSLGEEGVTSHKIQINCPNSAGVCWIGVIFGMIIQYLVEYVCRITNPYHKYSVVNAQLFTTKVYCDFLPKTRVKKSHPWGKKSKNVYFMWYDTNFYNSYKQITIQF